jgi:hypothetical protein
MALAFAASLALGQAQSAAADLSGTVRDPNGAVVAGATVTARNKANGLSRETTTDGEGNYQIIGLPPGQYEVSASASGFAKASVTDVVLTVGQNAQLDIPLKLGNVDVSLTITGGDVALVETTSTTVANTIDQARIQNLPINQRDATGFALTLSTVGRDNGRPIGPAPTSGLNIGGQRGRSTLVQVDGSDFTDNSINAARSTVSQEAVQEYQVATNSYAPEFGRATGGIVNVVTKSGGNEVHGNVFGYLRHKSIQARNAFAPVINNDPGEKPPFTRVQYGATLGGPIKKDRTFYFISFEQRRRQESGFFTSDPAAGLGASATIPAIALGAPFNLNINPMARTFTSISSAQAAYINGLVTQGQMLLGNAATVTQGVQAICLARTYAFFASSGGTTALTGSNPLATPNDGSICPAISPILPSAAAPTIASRFLLSGAPVPLTRDANGNLIAFRPLSQLARIFPISESTTFFSVKGDHRFNDNHNFNVRFSYNPSDLTGIQDESQNQTLGQNDFSRTGIQTLRDTSVSAALNSVLSGSVVNELYFTFGRRKATFDSQTPGTAQQIIGTAFLGQNPFSPVNRVEKRYQIRDNINWTLNTHQLKFGYDVNWISIDARFDLNFSGLFNFGANDCANLITGCTGPAFSPVQSYGLGFPGVFIQGFGNPNSGVRNRPLAFFGQDTWKVRPNFTINYGLRYDVELTQTIRPVAVVDPLARIQLTATDILAVQDALGIQQGFPRDKDNFAPRFGFAWDVKGDAKTVVRGAFGLFYDHPLLAIAFNSDVGDGSQQQQSTLLPGSPSPTALFNATQVFQGTVCNRGAATSPFCAAAGGPTTPGVAASAEYQFGRIRFNDQTFTGFGPVLPFTLHVAKDFEYAYATQANLALEKQIGKDTALSASYIMVSARHLPHPQDINAPVIPNLIENFRRFTGVAPPSVAASFAGISIPSSAADPRVIACPAGVGPLCFTNQGAPWLAIIPGIVAAPLANPNSRVVLPAAANFFRPSGPNYFFVSSLTNGAVTPAIFNTAIAGSVRTPGVFSPFGDISAQVSNANSYYHAGNFELKKKFAPNFQFLASYTWAHAIDFSSDLQTLLKPLDNRNLRLDKADSLFDQRHRFVFSGFLSAPSEWSGSDSGLRRFLHGFTIAPILEVAAGRPFNILTGEDRNADQQGSNERPSVDANGVLFLPPAFTNATLGRNRGITHGYVSLDLGVTRGIRFSERVRLDLIGQAFNIFNRFNEAAASPLFTDVNAFGQRNGGKFYSRPTAAFDPRQFQLGFKLNF